MLVLSPLLVTSWRLLLLLLLMLPIQLPQPQLLPRRRYLPHPHLAPLVPPGTQGVYGASLRAPHPTSASVRVATGPPCPYPPWVCPLNHHPQPPLYLQPVVRMLARCSLGPCCCTGLAPADRTSSPPGPAPLALGQQPLHPPPAPP